MGGVINMMKFAFVALLILIISGCQKSDHLTKSDQKLVDIRHGNIESIERFFGENT